MMIFKSLPQEKASPGYFTNGIYTISPILFDIANQKAHIFRKKYLKKYNKEPGWYAAFYYDAANVACEAMKRAEIQGRGHIRRDRREIKKALESMYSLDTGIQGVQGYIYFDENGDSNGPLGIGFYWNQKLLPAFSQYHLKTIPEDDLENGPVGKVLSGEFVMIGDRVMSNKKIVYVGVDINALNGLDMKNLTYYQTDFYLWFRYKGKINGADNIKFADIIEPVNLGNPVSERKYGDITIKTYHVKTEFRGNFDFHDYPFDKHKLKIKFNHKNITRDNIIYVSDILGMSGSEKKDSAIETTDVTGVQGYENIITNVSSLGIPEYFHDRKILNYSQFCAEISIDKDSTDSILRYFLPIIIILLVLYSIYFISVENFFIRLLIPISVLAANAFYHVKLLSDLQVEYITALEYSYFVIYLLIVLGMALVLIINNRLKKEKHKTIKKLLYVGRIIHPLIILISGFLLYF
jgi:branched-chain amino acid transport system substrate-binding protein